MFQQLHDAVPKDGSLSMSVSSPEEGKLTVTVSPVYPEGNGKNAQPLVVQPFSTTGTVEEFEVDFPGVLDTFSTAMKGFNSNIDAVLADLEGKKPKGKKAKAEAADAPDRIKGKDANKLLVEALEKDDLASDTFQSALRTANLKTLEKALPQASGLTRQKLIAREIHEVGGKEVKDVLAPVLVDSYKANQAVAANMALAAPVRQSAVAAMDQIGDALVSLTGKDLASMGLDPAQTSLLDASKGGE